MRFYNRETELSTSLEIQKKNSLSSSDLILALYLFRKGSRLDDKIFK